MFIYLPIIFLLCVILLKAKSSQAMETTKKITQNLTPTEALEELVNGNERYINDLSMHFTENAIRRQHTAIHGQYPIATVLACSDARMPVETIMDQGNGDIFVIRVAGNIVGDQVLGSIDYSLTALDVPLILVLGHTQCGAISSAIDAMYANQEFTPHIKSLLLPLLPLAEEQCSCHPNPTEDELSSLKEQLIFQNVWKEVSEIIRSSKAVRERIRANTLMVVGAVYDIQTGEVGWLGTHQREAIILSEYED